MLLAAWTPGQLVAQAELADSLRKVLGTTPPSDTNRVILLNELAWELRVETPEEARELLNQSLSLSRQLAFRRGEGAAYNYYGVLEATHNNISQAVGHYSKALDIRLELGDRKGVASLYNNLGNAYEDLGDYVSALENYRQSLYIREELGDTLRMGRVFYNLAIVHETMGNYPEALDLAFRYLEVMDRHGDQMDIAYGWNVIGNIRRELSRLEEALQSYEQALDIFKAESADWEMATVYTNIGNIKDDLGEATFSSGKDVQKALSLANEAFQYYQQAIDIRHRLQDRDGEAQIYNNLGSLYKNIGTYQLAQGQSGAANNSFRTGLFNLNRSLHLFDSLDNKKGMIETYNAMGDVKRRERDYEAALDFTNQYLQLAQETGDQKFIIYGYKDLSRIYAETGRWQEAFDYRKKYDEARYANLDEQRVKANARREAMYSDSKKQLEIERQQQAIRLQSAELKRAATVRRSLLLGALGLTLLALALYVAYRVRTRANHDLAHKNRIIEEERRRSEALLLNILPEETAAELKQNGVAQARRFESVTVLFTDFKSFTQYSDQVAPEELVAELDYCFRRFDEITSRLDVEKIKTIGDAFMCVAGLPVQQPGHAIMAVQTAIEIQQFMYSYNAERKAAGKMPFETRIGLHSGPVVAGIVGQRKFAYDIWGDTVNTAARMESSGEPGKINLSAATYQLVKDQVVCIPRGQVAAKNKGDLDMYFVEIPSGNAEAVQHLVQSDRKS